MGGGSGGGAGVEQRQELVAAEELPLVVVVLCVGRELLEKNFSLLPESMIQELSSAKE